MRGSKSQPRLVPDTPLPPYAYVTGRFPHPTSDPAGHSFGHPSLTPPPIDPQRWYDSREYLLGCDLFNYGYSWEAHELWESLWQACGRRGAMADFLKGLIKLAAAGVKAREGRSAGVQRHAARARELFERVEREVGDHYLGLDIPWLTATAATLDSHLMSLDDHAAVVILFDFTLLPRASQ